MTFVKRTRSYFDENLLRLVPEKGCPAKTKEGQKYVDTNLVLRLRFAQKKFCFTFSQNFCKNSFSYCAKIHFYFPRKWLTKIFAKISLETKISAKIFRKTKI